MTAPLILLTMGDPSGIGPEVVLKSLASRRFHRRRKDFLIIGDAATLAKVKKQLKIRVSLHYISDVRQLRRDAINVYSLDNVPSGQFKFGVVKKTYGEASIAYLDTALSLMRKCDTIALVTAPVNKESVRRTISDFSGHTEYLAQASDVTKIAMILIGGPLRVTLLTRHLPLKEVPRCVTKQEIYDAIELTHRFLSRYLGKRHPVIGITSLNPHGGEGGSLGKEEQNVIKPAVAELRKRYRSVYGPVAAEALFYDAYHRKVDGILSMYHDQGLVPLKMIARDTGINVTVGLPFIRTSPAHGTAFDIAGKGVANPSSMIEALAVAANLLRGNVT